MKTLIIVILLVLLLAVAYFTRPSESSFKAMVQNQVAAAAEGGKAAKAAEGLAEETTFHDRYLWTSVERDGKTIYVGALAHWFDVGSVKEAVPDTTTSPIKVKAPV